MRRRLLHVLNNREELTRSAKASFRQHSQDGNVLQLQDLYKAVQKICINLQIPPVFVEDPNVENVVKGFTRGNDEMTFREFFEFYYQLLSGIQQKYYPAQTVPWERANHVGDFELDGVDIRSGQFELTRTQTFMNLGSSLGRAHSASLTW
ncbi:MAG: uncharacterized protein KVP18_003160 [Porospora cf. gigantea A]|uniref:uncharacterized protein n=1 Tax=Porospora cf. gigantea A TaxID=2853593 RepID=UPI00355AAC75|nr:MAG: hypothetical protein KVP18_003160 [Porospora cf. gigantea A]